MWVFKVWFYLSKAVTELTQKNCILVVFGGCRAAGGGLDKFVNYNDHVIPCLKCILLPFNKLLV